MQGICSRMNSMCCTNATTRCAPSARVTGSVRNEHVDSADVGGCSARREGRARRAAGGGGAGGGTSVSTEDDAGIFFVFFEINFVKSVLYIRLL